MYRYRKLIIVLLLGLVLSGALVSFSQADAGQGRVRLAHFVFNAPAVDMLVDGAPVETNVVASEVAGYVNLDAGAHQIAVQSSEGASGSMVSASTSINIESGEDYALALVGQMGDNSIHLLTIDETAAFKGVDTANEGIVIVVDNLQGVPAIDLSYDDASLFKNLTYGNYAVGKAKAGNFTQVNLTASGDPKTAFLPPFPPGYAFQEPGSALLVGMMGTYPGDFGSTYLVADQPGTPLTVSQFLAGFSGRGIGFRQELASFVPFKPQTFSFDTLVSALDKAGLKDMVDAGPYILFAPTDAAFAALPAGTLDKWMADPQTLSAVLRYHIAQGTLSATDLAMGKDLNTLDGSATVHIADVGDNPSQSAFTINGGVAGCGCNFWTKNNNRIFVIDAVLTPPTN